MSLTASLLFSYISSGFLHFMFLLLFFKFLDSFTLSNCCVMLGLHFNYFYLNLFLYYFLFFHYLRQRLISFSLIIHFLDINLLARENLIIIAVSRVAIGIICLRILNTSFTWSGKRDRIGLKLLLLLVLSIALHCFLNRFATVVNIF